MRHSFERGADHPNWKGGRYISVGYVMILQPSHPRAKGGYVQEHILFAEKALGRMLPPKAEIHHVNESKQDNSPGNLVLCPDRAYHHLLHARSRAFDATGNPNLRRCPFCKRWDSPDNLHDGRGGGTLYHKACASQAMREKRAGISL